MYYAKRGVSADDLEKKIDSCECGLLDIMSQEQIQKDIACSGIEFDCENTIEYTEDGKDYYGLSLGYSVLDNEISVKWLACGGDWEFPVAVCLYLGLDDKIHLYVPENGNVYNRKRKSAYGNNDDFDCTGVIPWYKRWMFKFNMKKLIKDASDNIISRHY